VSTVVEVYPDSPAAKAGLEAGDTLVSVNGRPVERYQQLLRRIAVQGPGVVVRLGLLRKGKPVTASALLSTRPGSQASRTLISSGRLDALGLVVGELEPSQGPGVRVEAVVPGSTGELAGLLAGDRITEVNRIGVTSLRMFQQLVADTPVAEPVLLKFSRGSSSRYVAIKRR
jgi:serine protease DegQ